MNILTAMRERLESLARVVELSVAAHDLPASTSRLSDASLIAGLRDLAALANDVARLQSVLAGVAAHRSRREDGHSGLAATQGHATPAALVQAITGGTRAEAQRQVRVGQALLDDDSGCGAPGRSAGIDDPAAGDHPTMVPESDHESTSGSSLRTPWHDPLRRALLEGRITTAQHDAIRRGLGAPTTDGADALAAEGAWSVAAEMLVDEAAGTTVEDLAARARTMRDMLDPAGAEERFARRYDARSWRTWIDENGQHHARVVFDDEAALWVRSLLASAVRPRRGGPRFVTEEEQTPSAALRDDPRTNEQIEYDLIIDVLRAGSLAQASDVFGARQPGVRMVVVKDLVGPRDPFGRLLAVGHAEDGGQSLPGTVIDRALCMHGSTEVTVDGRGNPLDVGREQRLFTPKQRLALAVRDGGCVWHGCRQPASYCEAHHIDHYVADGGRTDIDRGVLLCRFHHMLLHNRGWRIERFGSGPLMLRAPGDPRGGGTVLTSKATWRWAWDPPPLDRKGWRAA